jgi:hypothetical protein
MEKAVASKGVQARRLVTKPSLVTRSHAPARGNAVLDALRPLRSAWPGLKTTLSVADGIPTVDRGNEEIGRNDSDQRDFAILLGTGLGLDQHDHERDLGNSVVRSPTA